MTGSSGSRLPKLLTGPLINSPIDSGTDSPDLQNIRKGQQKNDLSRKVNKKKVKDKDNTKSGRRSNAKGSESRHVVHSSSQHGGSRGMGILAEILAEPELPPIKSMMEQLEEAKMAQMESYFRKLRDMSEDHNYGPSTSRDHNVTNPPPKTHHIPPAMSRERLSSLVVPTTNTYVINNASSSNHEDLIHTAKIELDAIRRHQNGPNVCQIHNSSTPCHYRRRQSAKRNCTNNSIIYRRPTLSEWMRSLAEQTNNARATSAQEKTTDNGWANVTQEKKTDNAIPATGIQEQKTDNGWATGAKEKTTDNAMLSFGQEEVTTPPTNDVRWLLPLVEHCMNSAMYSFGQEKFITTPQNDVKWFLPLAEQHMGSTMPSATTAGQEQPRESFLQLLAKHIARQLTQEIVRQGRTSNVEYTSGSEQPGSPRLTYGQANQMTRQMTRQMTSRNLTRLSPLPEIPEKSESHRHKRRHSFAC